MADLPAVSDLLSASFATADWCDIDKVNRDENGNLRGSVPESQSANHPTAEYANGVCAALRQLSTFVRGTASVDAWSILNTLKIPVYTTATRPAAGTAGRIIYDSDLDALFADDGAAWDRIGAADVGDLSDDVLLDLEFDTMANNTLADGTESIGGVNWTVANAAAATTFAIENGTGLHFDATTTSTAYTTSTRTASYLRVALGTVIPGYDPLRTYVVEAYFPTLTIASSSNRVLLAFDQDGAGTDRLAGGGPRGAGPTTSIQQDASIQAGASNGGHNTYAIRISPDGITSLSGTYSSGFPTYSLVGGSTSHATPTNGPNPLDPSSFLVIAFVTGEVGGAMDVVLRRLRVRRIA